MYLQQILDESKIHGLLVDDGFSIPAVPTISYKDVPSIRDSKRILRLETSAEEAFKEALDNIHKDKSANDKSLANLDVELNEGAIYNRWRSLFRQKLHDADVVAFKSIAAYRCGLENLHISPRNSEMDEDVRLAIKKAENSFSASFAIWRLEDPVLVRLVVGWGLVEAEKAGVPVQFHVGIGDKVTLCSSVPKVRY